VEMAQNNQNRKKRRRFNTYRRSNQPVFQCPFCGENIRDLNTAIARREDGAPSHFDCVVKALNETEDLQKDERIWYLGNGSFGIVKERPNSRNNRFFIRKRIQYEDNEKKIEWRKNISEEILKRNRKNKSK